MQARCRRSLIWVVPFLMVALAGWAGARSAAADGLEAFEAPCAPTAQVAAFAAPEWAAQETGSAAAGTESGAMGSEPPGMEKPAGPSCTTNAQCHDTKMWCAKPNGHCKGKGACTAKPDVCPDVVAPVCGCNGKTYNNECMAHRAGVNVRADGKCKPKKATKPAAAKSTP
jgi:hypothetical protein